MKRFDLKVKNSSKYWTDFESELSAYYHFKWVGDEGINRFIDNEFEFIKKFILMTHKYGLVLPINYTEENLQKYHIDNKDKDIRLSNIIAYIYNFRQTTLVYPSRIFTDVNDKFPKTIFGIDPIIELKDIKSSYNSYGNPPLRVELWKKENQIEIVFNLDNDIFNSWIDNKKTKRDPAIGGKDCWVDNSDLAYLNTPRLNSFLRDLKKLCFEYEATEFEFENLGLNDFTENGVSFSNEIVYYEDIYEMLAPKYRVVNL